MTETECIRVHAEKVSHSCAQVNSPVSHVTFSLCCPLVVGQKKTPMLQQSPCWASGSIQMGEKTWHWTPQLGLGCMPGDHRQGALTSWALCSLFSQLGLSILMLYFWAGT